MNGAIDLRDRQTDRQAGRPQRQRYASAKRERERERERERDGGGGVGVDSWRKEEGDLRKRERFYQFSRVYSFTRMACLEEIR